MESLYRQRAALHPEDSWKLLAEAEKWRHRALGQIAARFEDATARERLRWSRCRWSRESDALRLMAIPGGLRYANLRP